jgi:hypothetical protein
MAGGGIYFDLSFSFRLSLTFSTLSQMYNPTVRGAPDKHEWFTQNFYIHTVHTSMNIFILYQRLAVC